MNNTSQKYSVRSILTDNNNWDRYKLNHSVDSYREKEIERMLQCCNPEKGFFTGYCKKCNKDVTIHLSCNGKVCSRCGTKYVNKWAKKAKNKVAQYSHRLITLTVPADLRPLLFDRWDLLKILEDSAYQTLQEVACKVLRRKKLKLGMLVGLQTYGQDMRFHPHLHCMLLERAYCKGGELKLSFIPKILLMKTWQRIVITNLCRARIDGKDKELVCFMFEKYPQGFVTDVGSRSLNKIFVIRYLARYMRHPAMANSRILFYGRGKVVIKMQDKFKRNYSTYFTIDEFITRVIAHISPKQFRVVRWYGVYSRREVRLTREKVKQETMVINSEEKKGNFICPECKTILSEVIFVPSKPPNDRVSRQKLDYYVRLAN